jgi:hypothetical protein
MRPVLPLVDLILYRLECLALLGIGRILGFAAYFPLNAEIRGDHNAEQYYRANDNRQHPSHAIILGFL